MGLSAGLEAAVETVEGASMLEFFSIRQLFHNGAKPTKEQLIDAINWERYHHYARAGDIDRALDEVQRIVDPL